MYCKNCGQPLADNQNFCSNCGAMNEASANTNQQDFNQDANQNNCADQSYNAQFNNQQYSNNSQQYGNPNQQFANAPYGNQQYANNQNVNSQYLGGKDKTTIALLAFFLGGFGVHNFVMGETKKGIIKIVLAWTGISGILALIDFVKVLTGDYVVDPDKYI